MTSRNPVVRWRVAVTVLVALVVYVTAALAIDIALRSWPIWALSVLNVFVCVVAVVVVAHWMKPWYRPAPRKPGWTEDMLP